MNKKAMIKKVSFGKVDGYHIGRKTTTELLKKSTYIKKFIVKNKEEE